jgi:hypothetical protein
MSWFASVQLMVFISKGEKQLRGGLAQTTRLRWKNSIGFGLKMRKLSQS